MARFTAVAAATELRSSVDGGTLPLSFSRRRLMSTHAALWVVARYSLPPLFSSLFPPTFPVPSHLRYQPYSFSPSLRAHCFIPPLCLSFALLRRRSAAKKASGLEGKTVTTRVGWRPPEREAQSPPYCRLHLPSTLGARTERSALCGQRLWFAKKREGFGAKKRFPLKS